MVSYKFDLAKFGTQFNSEKKNLNSILKRSILQTRDGSTTIHIAEWDECYHSRFGAIQEAQHVFIKNGLSLFENEAISILEIGFGNRFECFYYLFSITKLNQSIDYVGVEAYPVSAAEVVSMNYVSELKAEKDREIFKKMHKCNWEEQINLSDNFLLTKRQQFFEAIIDVEKFDLIYFDAFGFDAQPELWSTAIFKKCILLSNRRVF